MPRAAGGDLFIRGIFQRAAGIAGNRADDAGNIVKVGFNAPETAAGERRNPKIIFGGTGYGRCAYDENSNQQGRSKDGV